MKTLAKLIGIIALVAVIGFSMAACGGSDDDDGGGGGADYGDGWPSTTILSQWGIGTAPPATVTTGATDVEWGIYNGALFIYYTGDTTVYTAVTTWLNDDGWTGGSWSSGRTKGGTTNKIMLYTEDGERVIRVGA